MKFCKLATAVTTLVLSTSANAALVERLGGLAYYDTDADLTWLADANYALTSGFDADGHMDWATANSWAAGLNIAGVTGWRLPDTDPAIRGFDQSGSEMGNLFYNVLGGEAGTSLATTHNANYDLFSNLDPNFYWSATEHATSTDAAWVFDMYLGFQNYHSQSFSTNSAWAVYTGDVSAIPVPAAVWLFGSGLLGLVGIGRRKNV